MPAVGVRAEEERDTPAAVSVLAGVIDAGAGLTGGARPLRNSSSSSPNIARMGLALVAAGSFAGLFFAPAPTALRPADGKIAPSLSELSLSAPVPAENPVNQAMLIVS